MEHKSNQLLTFYQQLQRCRCNCSGERVGGGVVWDRRGNPLTDVVLIGEAPGRDEIIQRRPFVGKAGIRLEKYLRYAGLTRADVFITNVVKCRTTKNQGGANRTPGKCEINACARWLDQELQIIAPGVILTLGDVALKRMQPGLSIGLCHGQPLPLDNYVLFPLYHPAASIYRPALEEVIKQDFIRLGQWLRERKLLL